VSNTTHDQLDGTTGSPTLQDPPDIFRQVVAPPTLLRSQTDSGEFSEIFTDTIEANGNAIGNTESTTYELHQISAEMQQIGRPHPRINTVLAHSTSVQGSERAKDSPPPIPQRNPRSSSRIETSEERFENT
jgi:hypothetical protein